jgi:competence protein ComEC
VFKEADNDSSIVGILSYGDADILFTGDASQSVEEYLVSSWGDLLDVEVLKVGHHGSKTATSLSLLMKTTPLIALVSAGKENQYGHPHDSVIDRLENFTQNIYETAKLGSIVLSSDGRDWYLEQ